MFANKFTVKAIVTVATLIILTSCSENETNSNQTLAENAKPEAIALDVYKSPTCGCCKKWISHINNHGIESISHSDENFAVIKDTKGIEPRYRSCHTAISKHGYVFEGHVPAKFIKQFINQPHSDDVIGLSVPAMPVGSPGMEVGDKFQPYKVLLLKSNGSYEVYATVQSYQEQF
jgi:hypothetical protein